MKTSRVVDLLHKRTVHTLCYVRFGMGVRGRKEGRRVQWTEAWGRCTLLCYYEGEFTKEEKEALGGMLASRLHVWSVQDNDVTCGEDLVWSAWCLSIVFSIDSSNMFSIELYSFAPWSSLLKFGDATYAPFQTQQKWVRGGFFDAACTHSTYVTCDTHVLGSDTISLVIPLFLLFLRMYEYRISRSRRPRLPVCSGNKCSKNNC